MVSKEAKLAKVGSEVVEKAGKGFLKASLKFIGERIIKALPFAGAAYTLFGPSDTSFGERGVRAIAGEIGVGPFDLEMVYDTAIGIGRKALEYNGPPLIPLDSPRREFVGHNF